VPHPRSALERAPARTQPPLTGHRLVGPCSQIKVRDLSGLAVTLSPADFQSWKEVRDELMSELKAGIKAECEVTRT